MTKHTSKGSKPVFIMSEANTNPNTKVLFVENPHGGLSLAKMSDIEQLERETKIRAYQEVVAMYETYTISAVKAVVMDRLKSLEQS